MDFETLKHLADAPDRLKLSALWAQVSRDDRVRALTAALASNKSPSLRVTVEHQVVGQLRGFRAGALRQWPIEKLALAAARLKVDDPDVLRRCLIEFHFPARAMVQATFFDRLSIPHVAGVCDELHSPASTPEQVGEAATFLMANTDSEWALFYLLCIWAMASETWPGLDTWLRSTSRLACIDRAVTAAQVPTTPAITPGEETAAAIEYAETAGTRGDTTSVPGLKVLSESATLSVLDELLIVTIVDAAGRVANALTADQLDTVLAEFASLNGRRHQSFYHIGFRDVLFDRNPDTGLPARNRERRRWYMAGYITGLARMGRSEDIVGLFDNHEEVRGLGDSGRGPSARASSFIFEALCECGRYADAIGAVTARALHQSQRLAAAVFNSATELLRAEDAALAEPLFTMLWQAGSSRMAAGERVDAKHWSDVRRRRAHCLRYTDNAGEARRLLEELVDDPDPDGRAAVLTDLGLMEAGYHRLHDLRYPRNQADIGDVCRALRRGQAYFDRALAVEGAFTGSHAHYVLGFLALLDNQYPVATMHLDIAASAFSRKPEVYSRGSLLFLARLHLAIARCHDASELQQLERARKWIREAIGEGLGLPDYLVGDTLDALSLANSDTARAVAHEVMDAAGERIIDHLLQSDVGKRSEPIVDALLRRAEDEQRALGQRAADARCALPLLLEQARPEAAAQALDVLEYCAQQGVGVNELREILRDPLKYQPAWDRHGAVQCNVSLAEASGEYAVAADLLARECHTVIAQEPYGYVDLSDELVQQIRSYGDSYAPIADGLQQRLDDIAGSVEDSPVVVTSRVEALRVLIVGGDETQARSEAAIRQEVLERFPNLTLEFLRTGWTSNWGTLVKQFERRLADADAVVFIRYMRTGFGQQSRKLCGDTPWRGCSGRGRKAITNSILAAAAAAIRT